MASLKQRRANDDKLPSRAAILEASQKAKRRLKSAPKTSDADDRPAKDALRSPSGKLDGSPLTGINRSAALTLSHKKSR